VSQSIEQKVRALPRAYQELFFERAGILMDSGWSQSHADSAAYVWVARAKREQEGKGAFRGGAS
jgi:hypothetical protein